MSATTMTTVNASQRAAIAPQHVQSYYAATVNPSPARPALQGAASADVCVIGAGFTGLSTALHLAEQGYQVIVLEGAKVSWGASGRNGGQLVNGFNRDLDGIARRYGKAAAEAIGPLLFEGAEIIRERVAKYAIACDLKPGNLFMAYTRKQMAALERRKDVWERYGHTGLELIPRERVREFVNTDLYCGGLLDRWGGHVHPLNLALGQAAAIESLGGTIHELSPVTRVQPGAKPVVYTDQGRVTADFVVACGNAYLGETVPELASKVLPASSQVIATEVLGEELARSLLPRDHCVEDMNYFLDYYRITGDQRLLFGGGTVYGGKDPDDIVAEIRPHLVKTFPQLKDKKIDFAWSGNIALTVSRVPHMGRLGGNVYFAHGYSGHGVTGSHLAGRLLAEAIGGQSQRLDAFARLKHIPFPGGRLFRVPLTRMGAWYFMAKEKLGL